MTDQEFTNAGRLLFNGYGWIARMAKMLDVRAETVGRWSRGHGRPRHVEMWVEEMAEEIILKLNKAQHQAVVVVDIKALHTICQLQTNPSSQCKDISQQIKLENYLELMTKLSHYIQESLHNKLCKTL